MACLMLGGVTFAVTYRTLPGADPFMITAGIHEQKAEDLLAIAFDTPTAGDSCEGGTLAEQWIIRGVNGDAADFKRRANSTFGEGVPTNLILDNLDEYMFLHEGFTGYGSASSSHAFDPDWSGAIAKNRLDHVAGTDKLTVDVLGSSDSHLLTIKGAAVEASVTFADGHVANKWGWTALPARATSWEGGANITLNTDQSKSTSKLELVAQSVSPTREPLVIRINVTPLFGGPNATSNLTVGTVLSVHLPPHWTDVTPSAALWEPGTAYGSDALGWTQNFTLTTKTSGTAMAYISAKPPLLPTHPFDLIELDLSNGSLGHAEIVVRYPGVPEGGLPRSVHTTMPYPLVPGAVALFGVTVANGGAEAEVRQIDLEIPAGYDLTRLDGEAPALFADADPLFVTTAHGGEWERLNGTHVRWNGSRVVGANDVEEWLVGIRVNDDPEQATAVEVAPTGGVESVLRFSNGYLHRSTSWGRAPGVIQHVVPPESAPGARDGYPHAALAAGTSQTYAYDAWLRRAGVNLTTTGSYVALPDGGDISSVQNALGNAVVNMTKRKVPMGSVLPVEQDFRSLAATIASEGAGGFTITNDLYAPPLLACDPVRSWVRASSTLPVAGISRVSLYDFDGLGSSDVFLAAADDGVYRVNPAGATVWSADVGAQVGALAVGEDGSGGKAVFVGTSLGQVKRLDPTGLELGEWTVTPSPSMADPALPDIRGLILDPASGLLLVRTEKLLEVRSAADGGLVGRRDLGANVVTTTNEWLDAQWGPEGDVYAISTHHAYQLDPADLTLDAEWFTPKEDPMGLAATPSGVYLARDGVILRYAAPYQQEPEEIIHGGKAVVATASGDATGDGVRDFIVVNDELDIVVVSGATGALEPAMTAGLFDWGTIGAGVNEIGVPPMWTQGEIGSQGCCVGMEPMEWPYTTSCDQGAPYLTVIPCQELSDPRNQAPVITQLVAKEGRVLMALRLGDVGRVAMWLVGSGTDEYADCEWTVPPPGHASALDLGAWTPLHAGATVIGSTDGILRVDAGCMTWEQGGAYDLEEEPSSQVGHFELRIPIPTGGFYGTHVLLTRVGWTDPVRGAQAVTLGDWFNVVAADGTPVVSPAYRLHVLVRDADGQLP